MIVERYTWEAKPGRRGDLIKYTKKRMEMLKNKGLTYRIYSPKFGTWNNVILEVEYENEEERQKYWATLEWTNELAEFAAKQHEMIGFGQTFELFKLE